MRHLRIILSILCAILISCNNRANNFNCNKEPQIKKSLTDSIELQNNLIVVVGELVSYKKLPNGFDNGIKAKYKVLELIYGSYCDDFIEFEAYDHYRKPEIVELKYTLLYISRNDNRLYLEKYMFDPVMKTKDGRWAGPYSSEYNHPYNIQTKIRPAIIDFQTEFSFPRHLTDEDGKQFTVTYPEPYFRNLEDKAVAVYGNYVPELFQLRKDGVLTARNLFGGRDLKDSLFEMNQPKE